MGEFHAGNLSYLLSEEELADLKPFFRDDPIHVPVAFDTCGLEGRYFLATRSGGQFRTLPDRVERDMGIICVVEGAYEIVWAMKTVSAVLRARLRLTYCVTQRVCPRIPITVS